MTRKDYILIAEALREHRPIMHDGTDWYRGYWKTCEAVADTLASDNPRFSREHFLAVVRGEKELNSRPARKVRGHVSFCMNRGIQNDGTCPM